MKRFFIILSTFLFALPIAIEAAPPQKPRLVVNIVVSQMRYDYIARFAHNFSNTGFKRLMDDGISFSDARYNFMQTTTPAALATLTTGADPSMHGVVSERWINYTTNKTEYLLADHSAHGLDCDAGIGDYSYSNLTVPTVGDRLKEQHASSKVVTIAVDPVSAVVMGGMSSDVYWVDDTRGNWISSSAYMSSLPSWVDKYNSLRIANSYLDHNWLLQRPRSEYVNTSYSVLDMSGDSRFKKLASLDFLRKKATSKDYPGILRTPAGNSLVTEFAKQAMMYEHLGQGEGTDMLNICYDTPRYVGEMFGGESMEVEDVFYRLDNEIGDLISYISANVGLANAVIVLTSDHGASDSYDYRGEPRERFNAGQFKIIVNGFLNAQYGQGDWVVDYCDRQLYLNRDLAYNKGLSLEEVQRRVAAFVLQFRGVAHVLTSTAMQNSYFAGSYAEMMQNSFYPKRSGDLTINLMPGWIEDRGDYRALSGSMYEYDTHVPLMILMNGFNGQEVSRTVNIRDVAPTMARIMRISRPIAANGEPIDEITKILE